MENDVSRRVFLFFKFYSDSYHALLRYSLRYVVFHPRPEKRRSSSSNRDTFFFRLFVDCSYKNCHTVFYLLRLGSTVHYLVSYVSRKTLIQRCACNTIKIKNIKSCLVYFSEINIFVVFLFCFAFSIRKLGNGEIFRPPDFDDLSAA